MISIGVCNRCGSSIMVPSFSVGPLEPSCPCETSDAVGAALALGHRFDARVQQLHTVFIGDLAGDTLHDIAQYLEEDVRNLCDGIDRNDSKTIVAFLIRLAALTRYAVVDCPELKAAAREL
jgi:hypothetical protein